MKLRILLSFINDVGKGKSLYSLIFWQVPTNIICVIRSRRLRWAGHVARMGEKSGAYRSLDGKRTEGDHLKDPVADGRII
jgi:hypothetical protein